MKARVFLVVSSLVLLVLAQFASAPSAAAQTVSPEPVGVVYLPAVLAAADPDTSPAPLPGDLRLLSSRATDLALSKTKFVYIEGENSSDQPICNVKAVVYFYDAWGNLAAKSDGVAMIDRLNPGQKTPILVGLYNAPAFITSHAVQLFNTECYIARSDVTVLSWNTRETSTGTEVFGEVRNDSGKDLGLVEATVTVYGDDGAIWSAARAYLPDGGHEFAPGQVGAYSIALYQSDLAGRPFVVQAQGKPK